MKSWLKHPLRVTGRLFWLGGELFLAALNYAVHCAAYPRDSPLFARAAWLHRTARRLLRIFEAEPQVSGVIPTTGLLVCNHLSYLDILVLATLTPAVFVAKREVKNWPVFGWFAQLAGTLFVHREKPRHVWQIMGEVEKVLDSGMLVILFPEGTSSNGQTVLPFKSSLLELATRKAYPVSVGLIQYELEDGDVGEEVCYWKDMTLLPHLLNLLSKRRLQAAVQFRRLQPNNTNRKDLARNLHSEVVRLKAAFTER